MPKAIDHEIMTKPLPEILDELRALATRAETAALDAEGHAQEAQDAAAKAGQQATDAVKKQVGYLEPRITDAQAVSGQALKLAKEALAAIKAVGDANTQAIEDLTKAHDNLRKDFLDFVKAFFDGDKEYMRYIMSRITFMKFTDEDDK